MWEEEEEEGESRWTGGEQKKQKKKKKKKKKKEKKKKRRRRRRVTSEGFHAVSKGKRRYGLGRLVRGGQDAGEAGVGAEEGLRRG